VNAFEYNVSEILSWESFVLGLEADPKASWISFLSLAGEEHRRERAPSVQGLDDIE
jgi:hypothetical protein